MEFTKDDKITIEKLLEEGLITDIKDLIGDKEASFMFKFMVNKFAYLLNGNLLNEDEIVLRKKVNVIIKTLGPLFLQNKQVFEDRNNLRNDKVYSKDINLPNEPVIYMPNHGFKDDPLASVIAAPRNAYFLFGSLPQFFNTFDGITAWLNGLTLVDRKSHVSKKTSIHNAIDIINHNVDLIIYPEGVLNKTSNLLALEYWAGIYKVAKETGVKVVPIVHYLRDHGPKSFMIKFNPTQDDIIHTLLDDPVKIDDLSEKAALEYLRDISASWYYLLMEKYGQTTREEFLDGKKTSLSKMEEELEISMNSIEYYDSSVERSIDYRSKDIDRPEDVFEAIANIKNVTKENVLDVMEAKKLVRQRKKEDIQRRF